MKAVRALSVAALACALGLGGAGAAHAAGGSLELGSVDQPLVVIGTSGLQWADIGAQTPALAAVGGTAPTADGSLVPRSVRATACPVDGWLALSAGARAAEVAVSGPGELDKTTGAHCGAEPHVSASGTVANWQAYRDAATTNHAASPLGSLAAALREAGVATAAVGPGAAIALADATGQVAGRYEPFDADTASPADAGRQVGAALQSVGSGVVVVDAGAVLVAPGRADRPAQVTALNERVAAILEATQQAGARVLLISLADDGTGAAQQAVSLSTGPAGRMQPGKLGAVSTHRDGLLQVADAASLVAALATGNPEAVVGAGSSPTFAPGSAAAVRASLADADAHARAVHSLAGWMAGVWAPIMLAVATAVVLHLRREGREAAGPRGISRVVRWAAWVAGCLPVATYLANLAPWWRAGPPVVMALGSAWLVALLAGTALWWWHTRRHTPRGLLPGWCLIGTLTAGVLVVDQLLGGRLSYASIFGPDPLTGGRYYGVTNVMFAYFAAGAIIATVGWLSPYLPVRAERPADAVGVAAGHPTPAQPTGSRPAARSAHRKATPRPPCWWAGVVTAGVGLVCVAVDGYLGADFGGVPPLLMSFAILALLVGGVRLTWRRIALVVLGAVVGIAALCLADYARGPEHWTHLGAFAADLLQGSGDSIVWRKAGQSLTWLVATLPGIAVLVAAGIVAWRTVRAAPTVQQLRRVAGLGSGLIALTIVLVAGAALNDTGVVIVACGVGVAGMALIAGLPERARTGS